MKLPTVIFQVTAIGKNVRALEESARSVLYWIRNTPALSYRYALWLVVEPEGYATDPRLYERLVADGARLFVVPKGYSTPLGTRGKARALEYACERRIEMGWSNAEVWVYHQDEETCVGQDTLEGISEFVQNRTAAVGAGIIIYPLDWGGGPSQIQELSRSYDDFRVLDSMRTPGNPTAGFHGSHFLVRADVEDTVGWDSRGYAPAEDLLFEIRVRARYGSIFGVLKGFAYEKGAFSLKDQLRQRRRWMHGVLHALWRTPELPVRRRLTVAYSALSWFSALPSIAILGASVLWHYGPLLLFTGIFTGFVWVSMVLAYIEGYRMHQEYIDRSTTLPRLIVGGLVGALVDVLAPWSALFARPSTQDFIPKDRPVDSPAARVPGARRFTGWSAPVAGAHGRTEPVPRPILPTGGTALPARGGRPGSSPRRPQPTA
ncbi:MAG: glycosyltransferase family 2 protein [Thermoplasmata archaeon]|nr:glycosyltransferase family 2 protein [Thermoplasmata archaeon]